jgi:FAD synthase
MTVRFQQSFQDELQFNVEIHQDGQTNGNFLRIREVCSSDIRQALRNGSLPWKLHAFYKYLPSIYGLASILSF